MEFTTPAYCATPGKMLSPFAIASMQYASTVDETKETLSFARLTIAFQISSNFKLTIESKSFDGQSYSMKRKYVVLSSSDTSNDATYTQI